MFIFRNKKGMKHPHRSYESLTWHEKPRRLLTLRYKCCEPYFPVVENAGKQKLWLKNVRFVTSYVDYCLIEVLNAFIGVKIEERSGNPASPLFFWRFIVCDSKQHNLMGVVCLPSTCQEGYDDEIMIAIVFRCCQV